MRTMTALALMLAVGVAGAQQPPPKQEGPKIVPPPVTAKKSALEDALDLALKNNPDLRVAASKLALAEAELNKARLQVTQKTAAAYADVEVARATVKEVERQIARVKAMFEKGALIPEEVYKAESKLVEAKSKLAAAERELAHLQGKGERDIKATTSDMVLYYERTGRMGAANFYRGAGQDVRLWSSPQMIGYSATFIDPTAVKTSGSDKLRSALQKPVTLSGQKMPLTQFLDLVKKAGGLGVQADLKDPAWKETVDFDFKDVTVGGMLQFLEDSLPHHRIVVRHYGLLIATREKVPEGAVTLTAFLHAEPAKPPAEKKPLAVPGSPARR